jgi:hypothetical protein
VIMLRSCLDDPADSQSHCKDWLSIRHTSPQFKALLPSVDLRDFNPFKSLLVTFDGEREDSFNAVFKRLTRRLEHMNALQSTTSFPITVGLEFLRCLIQHMSAVHAVFNSLECAPVIQNMQSLRITLATDEAHRIPIPTFPNLEDLYLRLDDAIAAAPSGEVCCLGQGIGNYENEQIHFIIRTPNLRTLTIITSNPSVVRIESPRYLEHLSLDLQRVGC